MLSKKLAITVWRDGLENWHVTANLDVADDIDYFTYHDAPNDVDITIEGLEDLLALRAQIDSAILKVQGE